MKNLLLFGLLITTLFITSCGSDDDGGSGPAFCTEQAYSDAVAIAVNDFSAAAQVYANDPSSENCEAYKVAAQAYLDELSRFENCATISNRQDYQDSIQEAQESIDMIVC
ncbi:hypothetical protein FUA23_12005 [Neolewinella aurantiaca]|uniref:Uncharacterized protein n=1 Tax=Neolewinella aurantiaca TaxID=2602767 RepID=A0A5C7FDH2_9BACT|nr:hypothetical protein [Neolewinella aurantiaca]TXF89006.1 hypothetical protein FUA23_12005 [Neolewinella aurantiaca]